MDETIFLKGALVLPERIIPNGLLRVTGARISGVWDLETGPAPIPPDGTVRFGGYICPGFVDLHVHGGGGADFMDGDPEAVATIPTTHARHGTTGLLATTLTAPEAEILRAIRAVKAAPRQGARVLGFHIEGPFINPGCKGAQDERFIRPPSPAEADRWMACGDNEDRWHMTLAPELPGAIATIRHLVGKGAIVSAGHTDCTYAQLREAVAAGVSHITHLFNGMRGLHHREPGTAGGALTLPGLTVEVIADGVHIHPTALDLTVRSRGPEDVLLVTDAMRATGLGDGEYYLGGLKGVVRGGSVRLADGTLAGSVLTMDRAVGNMVELAGVPLHQAVAMASLQPARVHGLQDTVGSLALGKRADIAILDGELRTRLTLVGGQIAYDGR